MPKIERAPHAGVVLRPSDVFFHWSLSFQDPDDLVRNLDADVFMIPDLHDAAGIHDWIQQHFTKLFILFLSDWTNKQTHWPDVKDYEVFCQFFDIEVMPMVWRVNV
jgi:hypothetical protein